MSFFKRFGAGVALGFLAAPTMGAASVVFCKSRNISNNGQTNHLFDDVDLPTKEELQYVKTWGVRWVDDWDRPAERGVKLDKDGSSSSARRQIILIRHGQYENESSHDDSIRKLTALGREQAKRTGHYLAELFHSTEEHQRVKQSRREAEKALKEELNASTLQSSSGLVPVENEKVAKLRQLVEERKCLERSTGRFLLASEPRVVYVSDMTRAKETARLILEGFPAGIQKRLVTDEQLRERFPCDPQPPHAGHQAVATDMKAVEDVFERYFYRPTSEDSSVEVIVGHANVIRYLTMRALQLPPEAWLRVSLPHCSITSIVINGKGRVSVSSVGSFGHLPPEMVTTRNIK